MEWEKAGRARMMMLFPRYRKQIADANFLAISDLLEAYGRSAYTRDELRERAFSDRARVEEYESLCRKLEDDLIRMLEATIRPTRR
ncbi:hypothetical protein N182_38045 [Sinorhizobium sp. GL2]|nr:hypothetical protein N182_38045 [Sinorhizobium sp. GL2]